MPQPPEVVPTPDFRSLFESAPALSLVLTPDLRIAAVSEAYLRATMTRREEILGRSIFEVFPDNPDEAAATGVGNLKASLDRVLRSRAADTMALQKYDIRRPEAEGGGFEERYWSAINSPILDENRKLTYIIHRVEDATEFIRLKKSGIDQAELAAEFRTRAGRMEAEIFLRALELAEANRSRALLETFVECAPVGVAMFDRDMRFLQVSRRWLEISGIAGQDVLGRSHYEVFPDLPEPMKERHRRGLAGESLSGEQEWKGAGGQTRSVHFGIQPWGRSGNEAGGIAIFLEDITERKRSEEALRESEAQFRSMYEHAAVGIEQVAPDGRLLMVNSALCRMLGYTRAELLSRTFVDITHPDDRAREAQLADALFRGDRESVEIEKRYVHRYGTTVWVNVTSSLVTDRDGRPLYRISIVQNITARIRAELEWRKFISLADNSSEFIGMCGMNFMPFYINQAGLSLVGIDSLEQSFRTPIQEVFFPEDQRFFMEEFMPRVLREGRAEVEIRFRHFKTGEPIWMITNVFHIKDAAGQPVGLATVSRNITARKQAEQALHASQERLAAIIDTAMDGIITLDEQQHVVLFNAAAERIFGCPASEVLGKPIDRFVPERFRGVHGGHIGEYLATAKNPRSMFSPGTVYGVRADGREFPIEATISQATTGGQSLHTVILRDVTEKKEAEELADLYAQTKELDRLKTEVFANLSHELRTPLALILGLVRKRLAAAGIAGDERRDLEVIDRNAGLLLRHVNDLLDLSKFDAGRMNADYGEVDLAAMVRMVASYFESLAEERGVSFAVQAPGLLTAQIDAPKIERSVLNLLSNAFKFTPAGGRVTVAVQAAGGRAVLEVEDTGPGIPPQMRELIFERFQQLDTGSTREFGGTGLGLSIAKQFVTLHGGSLTVKDAPGGIGSLFRMELPLAAPNGAVVRREAEEPDTESARRLAAELWAPRPLARVRAAARSRAPVVLLVEDNRDMNAFLSRTLEVAYRVIPAFDGQEGYDKALETRPDLILCDIMMPRMSGDELVRELRRQREFDDVPIVLLTAKADEALQVRLLQEGAQDYLYKPVVARELLAKVARLIADRARVAEALQGMRDLSEYLFQVDDRERKEVARELNENTAQCLASVEMNLARVQDSVTALSPDMQSLLADGIALLQSCVNDIQTMCFILYPSMLEHFGLKATTEAYVKGFAQRSGIAVSTEISREVGRLPAEFEVTLYRVMQEALTNVRRHSGSQTAVVRIVRGAGEVVVEVSDQGRGMDLEEGSKGIGLPAMRERMRNIGGRLEVVSGSGGTTVRATLPLGAPDPRA